MNHTHEISFDSIHNFYAKQSHLIDSSQHEAWAKTFTQNGEFHSPTYGAPAVGWGQLVEISKKFTENCKSLNEIQRHVFSNIWIVSHEGNSVKTQAYLSIIASNLEAGETKIVRIINIQDELVKTNDDWLVVKREVFFSPK